MSPAFILLVIGLYLGVLMLIAYFTSKGADNDSFFSGNKNSSWYVVAFGMIGASMSGVTFMSVPGAVELGHFAYLQVVLGYFAGYFVIVYVLLPIYYRMNLISIYTYLEDRFGIWTYKTGASFFMVSRILGASIRLLLVANVFQFLIFDAWGVPFFVTVFISIAAIWLYTYKGGIKTIVWTDTFLSFFMLLSLGVTVYYISDALNLTEKGGLFSAVADSSYSQIFFFDDITKGNHFLRQFLVGMFITIGMTGLDQDLMQKNLSCKNIKEAQKNMISFSFIMVIVNVIFLLLGATLYMYADKMGISVPMLDGKVRTDLLFPHIALHSGFPVVMAILFILGLIAAAYASADSALASLTTSFCVDFLNIKRMTLPDQKKWKDRGHILMSLVLLLTIVVLKELVSDNAIESILFFAGFTYGPLIGFYAFGIFTKRELKKDYYSLLSSALAIAFSIFVYSFQEQLFGFDYKIKHEMIMFNSLMTFVFMYVFSTKQQVK